MSNILNTFRQGSNLGMFNFGQPQPSQFGNIEELIGKLPADKQPAAREKYISDLSEAEATMRAVSPFMPRQYSIEELESVRQREAERAQKLGEQSLMKTMKAKMFYDMPSNIAKAFSGPAAIYYGGMSQVPNVYNAALSSFRPMQLTGPTVVSPASAPNYFG